MSLPQTISRRFPVLSAAPAAVTWTTLAALTITVVGCVRGESGTQGSAHLPDHLATEPGTVDRDMDEQSALETFRAFWIDTLTASSVEAERMVELIQNPPLPPVVRTEEFRVLRSALEGSIGKHHPNDLVLQGALSDLDRNGRCFVVHIDGLLGPGAGGCVDPESRRVIVAWITPEG